MRQRHVRKSWHAALALIGVCGLGCGSPTLAVPAGPAPGVRLRQTVTEYIVTGRTLPELKQSVEIRAGLQPDGRGFAGFTRSSINWTYGGSTMRSGGCGPTGVTVDLELAMRYPIWADSAYGSPAMLEEWRRYIAALKAHEANHAAITIKGANRLVSELRSLVVGNCDLLPLEARRRAGDIMRAMREEQRAYDQTTGHGATEGATLRGGT